MNPIDIKPGIVVDLVKRSNPEFYRLIQNIFKKYLNFNISYENIKKKIYVNIYYTSCK